MMTGPKTPTAAVAGRLAPLLLALMTAACGAGNRGLVPAYYPGNYHTTIDAAGDEGHILIWSAIDAQKAAPLVAAFRARFPRVRVDYVEMAANALNTRFLAAAARHQPVPDFLWSSAMDLQIKLVNDGFAQSYASPEASRTAGWSNWKNQAWGTTAEPIVFVYNRKLIADAVMPRTHLALVHYLETHPAAPFGTVATYDVPRSAVGFLYLSQDHEASRGTWHLLAEMAENGMRVFANAEQIMADVRAGRAAIGYNLIGSYALEQTRLHPELGMVLPRDYTLVVSRIAVIPRDAPHPAAARLFLDFLLSREGQTRLASARMPSVRSDVAAPRELAPAGVPLRAIRVGPGLLVDSDRLTRAYVERRWTDARTGSKAAEKP